MKNEDYSLSDFKSLVICGHLDNFMSYVSHQLLNLVKYLLRFLFIINIIK